MSSRSVTYARIFCKNIAKEYNVGMTVKELAAANPESPIGRAYALALRAHKGQKRQSGEPYFNHVLATAEALFEWHLDEATIIAGLLHDTVEDTSVTHETLVADFGEEVASLVDGVTKLGKIKYRGVEAKVENLRKMVIAISRDLRVIFVKLADRLHNMRTLGAVPPQKQKRIALETDEIYAPLAYRLGMQSVSGELRDLAFPYLYPEEDRWLDSVAHDEYAEREKYLRRIAPELEAILAKHGITPRFIDFRAKRRSSLYQKLLRHEMDLEKIYDLVAMRVILTSVSQCYEVLGIVHQMWPPLPGRIKDYIAMPKPNGYRSLHTTVIGPEGKYIEIQIRTQDMHDEDENGIAAHWFYGETRGRKAPIKPARVKEEVHWVEQLRTWQDKLNAEGVTHEAFLDSMKTEFFKGRIFVITPKGDVIDIPKDSTPVDFAYQIHSEIGNGCVGAKVNGVIVPLDHKLQSGDVVEIVVQKNKKPSQDWLGFVQTALAKDRIRAALRAKEKRFIGKIVPVKCELKVTVRDRIGLLKEISSAITESRLNIESIYAPSMAGGKFAINKIELNTANKKEIEKLVLKLKRINGVRAVSYQLR